MIIIPMAGLSSRFFKAGFNKPKYMLEAHGKTLFEHSILSFAKYFENEHFVFVIRDVYGTKDFVLSEVEQLEIKNADIVVLESETRGQAETVYIAAKPYESTGKELTIFNIDTFRPGFTFPKFKNSDGFLEVFHGTGDHWSFAEPENSSSTRVIRTTEKNRISSLCSTGLYHFSDISDFTKIFESYSSKPKSEWEKGELYVAPLYNTMISAGKRIDYSLINSDEVIFCGTPDEYSEFLSGPGLFYD